MPDNNELSEREQEILRLVATGASNKEIAHTLSISANTVKVHLRNIFAKIDAVSRTEAAMYAVKTGLVTGASRNGEGAPLNAEISSGLADEFLPGSQTIDRDRGRDTLRTVVAITIGVLLVLVVFTSIALYVSQRVSNEAASISSEAGNLARWQAKAKLPTPRYGLAVTAYENRIYAIGGESRLGISGVIERYDPSTDGWVELARKPTPVRDVQAAIIRGKIYVPGGADSNGSVTGILEIYDIRQNTWGKGASLPIALSAYALASHEGKLYLFGGWDGNQYVDTVYEYEPEIDAWNSRTALPNARGYAGAAVAGGNIYVIGGFDGENILDDSEIYSPVRDDGRENPWTKLASLPEARYAMGVTSVADFIYVFGGISDTGNSNNFFEYLPTENKWNTHADTPAQPASRLGVVAVQAHLYTLGGEYRGKLSDQNYAYQALYTVVAPIIR